MGESRCGGEGGKFYGRPRQVEGGQQQAACYMNVVKNGCRASSSKSAYLVLPTSFEHDSFPCSDRTYYQVPYIYASTWCMHAICSFQAYDTYLCVFCERLVVWKDTDACTRGRLSSCPSLHVAQWNRPVPLVRRAYVRTHRLLCGKPNLTWRDEE